MKLTLDTEQKTLSLDNNGQTETVPLYSDRAFDLISEQWLKVGWNQRYSYTFSWMGRPVIQLPEDIVRIQEVLYQVKPDVVIETGVAHGGSLILYASLFKAMGKGRVIGVDIEIRPHNREGIGKAEGAVELPSMRVKPSAAARCPTKGNRSPAVSKSKLLQCSHDHTYSVEVQKVKARSTGGKCRCILRPPLRTTAG